MVTAVHCHVQQRPEGLTPLAVHVSIGRVQVGGLGQRGQEGVPDRVHVQGRGNLDHKVEGVHAERGDGLVVRLLKGDAHGAQQRGPRGLEHGPHILTPCGLLPLGFPLRSGHLLVLPPDHLLAGLVPLNLAPPEDIQDGVQPRQPAPALLALPLPAIASLNILVVALELELVVDDVLVDLRNELGRQVLLVVDPAVVPLELLHGHLVLHLVVVRIRLQHDHRIRKDIRCVRVGKDILGVADAVPLCVLEHEPVDLLGLAGEPEPAKKVPETLVKLHIREVQHFHVRVHHVQVERVRLPKVLPDGSLVELVLALQEEGGDVLGALAQEAMLLQKGHTLLRLPLELGQALLVPGLLGLPALNVVCGLALLVLPIALVLLHLPGVLPTVPVLPSLCRLALVLVGSQRLDDPNQALQGEELQVELHGGSEPAPLGGDTTLDHPHQPGHKPLIQVALVQVAVVIHKDVREHLLVAAQVVQTPEEHHPLGVQVI
mmetsp:Transcript_7040/g.25480  ORF Transcript_7040/g.25480 Transcript_7040/m.25480 type:complete len:488 (-) Transcript_7040:425-1888(-)